MATQAESNANIETLISQHGLSRSFIDQQIGLGHRGPANGNKVDTKDIPKFITAFQNNPGAQSGAFNDKLGALSSKEFEFDPNKFLPGIKEQATSIFQPQKLQLEALRQLQLGQAEDVRIQTVKDFDKQLQDEIEAINSRGAFFGGGAIEAEGEIRDAKSRALSQIGLQASAADFNNLAQQGILGAEESQFIQDRLFNAEGGAYNRWADQRNFDFQSLVQQYQIFSDERNFARDVFESDRTFDQNEEQFKQTYKINEEAFRQGKENFKIDIERKKLSYKQALENFKDNTANTNIGDLGLINGQDAYEYISERNANNLGAGQGVVPVPGGELTATVTLDDSGSWGLSIK